MAITLAEAKVGMADHVDQMVIDEFRRPNFKNGETWELSFKDKVLAAQKVGEGT